MGSQIIADDTYLDDNGTVHRNGKILGTIKRAGLEFETFDAKGDFKGSFMPPMEHAARKLLKTI